MRKRVFFGSQAFFCTCHRPVPPPSFPVFFCIAFLGSYGYLLAWVHFNSQIKLAGLSVIAALLDPILPCAPLWVSVCVCVCGWVCPFLFSLFFFSLALSPAFGSVWCVLSFSLVPLVFLWRWWFGCGGISARPWPLELPASTCWLFVWWGLVVRVSVGSLRLFCQLLPAASFCSLAALVRFVSWGLFVPVWLLLALS